MSTKCRCACRAEAYASGGETATFTPVSGSDSTVFAGRTETFHYPADSETGAGNGLTRVFGIVCGSRVSTNDLTEEIFTWGHQPSMPALPVPQYDHGVAAAAVPAVTNAP